MRAGARGYLHGSSSITLLRNAIRAVHRGELFCDVNGTHAPAAGQALAPPGHLRLSPREFEVFLMLGGGMRVVEIAAKLGLSPKTVSTHRSRILEKTGLDDNAAIVRCVHTSGLNQ
jgi:DNA-binding NarL/FixJ family response regulator